MAKAQSDTIPPAQIMSRGRTQVNYNVQEVEITDDQGTRTAYEYDYVEITGKVTRTKVMAAMEAGDREDDPEAWTPDDVATEHSDAKAAISLSGLAEMTYAQLDAYIDANVTDMASARAYLRKLSKVVLALVKQT
ncbi:hypothetical protein K8R42_03160 [bacterium]|nr:hypothetical protein [bacterium]